ncbi:hypothetical protein J3F84DRAFT_53615 [Trichoderma pleuroticola]
MLVLHRQCYNLDTTTSIHVDLYIHPRPRWLQAPDPIARYGPDNDEGWICFRFLWPRFRQSHAPGIPRPHACTYPIRTLAGGATVRVPQGLVTHRMHNSHEHTCTEYYSCIHTWTRPSYAPRRRTPFPFPRALFCGCWCQGTYMYGVQVLAGHAHCIACLVPCLLGMTTVCAHPWPLVCVSHAHIHQSILFIPLIHPIHPILPRPSPRTVLVPATPQMASPQQRAPSTYMTLRPTSGLVAPLTFLKGRGGPAAALLASLTSA